MSFGRFACPVSFPLHASHLSLCHPARTTQSTFADTPGLGIVNDPISFSFDFDATTNAVLGTPTVDFMGKVFAYSPASLLPTDFEFTNGTALISIGDIGLFPQPGRGLPPATAFILAFWWDGAIRSFPCPPITDPQSYPWSRNRPCFRCSRPGLLFLGVALSLKFAR